MLLVSFLLTICKFVTASSRIHATGCQSLSGGLLGQISSLPPLPSRRSWLVRMQSLAFLSRASEQPQPSVAPRLASSSETHCDFVGYQEVHIDPQGHWARQAFRGDQQSHSRRSRADSSAFANHHHREVHEARFIAPPPKEGTALPPSPRTEASGVDFLW